ncbi:hypothetical protein P692DRAFT_20265596 [Suillus brevipes Sb2]|nr:hypothetical protein P692DRAFT_20265596 [Suillus brevipes Sb2]
MKSEYCKKKAPLPLLSLSLTSTARQASRRRTSRELTRRFSMPSRIISTFSFIPFLYGLLKMVASVIVKRSSSRTSINRLKKNMQKNRDVQFTQTLRSIFHVSVRFCSFHCQTGYTLVIRQRLLVRQGTMALACLWNQRARSDGVQGI